jgi:hypothetical protein
MIYYHRIGTTQGEFDAIYMRNETPLTKLVEDILVMKDDENPEWMWGVEISEVDGRYLMLYTSKDTDRVRFQDRFCLLFTSWLTVAFLCFWYPEKQTLDYRS